MKRLLLTGFVCALSAAPVRADLPPPPPPPPPGAATTAPVVAGAATTVALVLAGAWLLRSRRRAELRG